MSDDADRKCEETYAECLEAKRQLAAEAIAANPTASSRELAKDLPVTERTVRRIRRDGQLSELTNPTKKARAAEAVAKDPGRRNVAIAAMIGCSEKTVRDARKSITDSNVIQMSAKLREAGVTQYPTKYSAEVMGWIGTYLGWPNATKRRGREAFFATINGVKINAG